jgi:hypothetical protein
MPTIEQIREAGAAQARAAARDWRSLIREVAGGGPLGAEEVAGRLRDLGKTADDLDAAIRLRARRQGWANDLNLAPAAQDEIAHLNEQLEELEEERAAAIESFRLKQLQLNETLQVQNAKLGRATEARRQLVSSAPGEIVEEIAAARREVGAVIGERQRLAAYVADMKRRRERERQALEDKVAGRSDYLRGRSEGAPISDVKSAFLDELDAKIAECDGGLNALSRRLDELQLAVGEMENQLLLP